jgi:hypothetical protein
MGKRAKKNINLATCYTNHYNASCIITAQSVTSDSRVWRSILAQCPYMLLLCSPRIATQLRGLSKRVFKDGNLIEQASQYLTSKQQRFVPLLIDLDASLADQALCRLRSIYPLPIEWKKYDFLVAIQW